MPIGWGLRNFGWGQQKKVGGDPHPKKVKKLGGDLGGDKKNKQSRSRTRKGKEKRKIEQAI